MKQKLSNEQIYKIKKVLLTNNKNKRYGHERYVLSFSENVLIDWVFLMSFGSSFQLLAAENMKAFLAILVPTFGSIKLCFAFLVPALWIWLDIVNIALM